jgi:hypothetical protein
MFTYLFDRDFSPALLDGSVGIVLTAQKLRRQADHAWKTMFLSSYLRRSMGGDL